MQNPTAKLVFLALLIFTSIGCDRVTKQLAKTHLEGREVISYLNDTVRLVYVENPGAAMSFGADWSPALKMWFLTILPTVVLLGVFGYVLLNFRNMHTAVLAALGLIVAGGVGNMIDRFFNNSYVPDFMNLGIEQVRTGIFNVADVCITIGVVMMLFLHRKA
jgi:signal peptidase II